MFYLFQQKFRIQQIKSRRKISFSKAVKFIKISKKNCKNNNRNNVASLIHFGFEILNPLSSQHSKNLKENADKYFANLKTIKK